LYGNKNWEKWKKKRWIHATYYYQKQKLFLKNFILLSWIQKHLTTSSTKLALNATFQGNFLKLFAN
jgi:hypothetical protein